LSLAQLASGEALAWGRNDEGELGTGVLGGSSMIPVRVALPDEVKIVGLAAGDFYALALSRDGEVWAWGGNSLGQLGDGSAAPRRASPVQVRFPQLVQVVSMAAGGSFALALDSNGQLWGWGANGSGNLGDGSSESTRSTPGRVAFPAPTQVAAFAAGHSHALALSRNGEVWAWGDNGAGQLGTGSNAGSRTPVQVVLPAGTRLKAVAAGAGFSIGLDGDGTVWAWGGNNVGQLGTAGTDSSSLPTHVALPAGVVVASIVAGGDHVLALTTDGHVFAWGNNIRGQLGIGRIGNQP
jgi:alpha-tubulin suppressor-like RCC1 family protein